MSLVNQHWIGFNGEPVTGRTPTQTRIMNDVPMNALQAAGVAHAYKLFTDAVLVTPSKFLTRERTLLDGTRVRMVSNQGIDVVLVWPVGGEKNFELPHGFVVVTPYSDPRIYMRDNITGVWSFLGIFVPQAAEPIISTNQVYVDIADLDPDIMPLVVGSDNSQWDWAAHASINDSVAVNLLIEEPGKAAEREYHPAHFVKNGRVLAHPDTLLYEMTDVRPPWDLEGDVSPFFLPAVTDSKGTRLALQAYREKQFFSTPFVDIQHQHVILKRTGDVTYAQFSHLGTSFRVPAWTARIETVSRSTNDLDDATPDISKIKLVKVFAPSPLLGPQQAGTFIVDLGGFGYYWKPLDTRYYFGVIGYTETALVHPAIVMSGEAFTRESVFIPGPEADPGCIAALPDSDTVRSAFITNQIVYPTEEYMRGGFAYASTGWAPGYFEFGTRDLFIDRRDSRYKRTGTPKLVMTVPGSSWLWPFHLFEGSVHGELTGSYKTDKEYRTRDTSLELYRGYNLLPGGQPSFTSKPNPGPPDQPFGTIGTFHLDYEAEILAQDRKAQFTVMLDTPIGLTTTREIREHPSMSGEYNFTSRFIIDLDTRAKFLAAIVVDVKCEGAQWDQNMDNSFPGALKITANPTYTVEIRFESNWNGVTASRVLATASCTRPAFEFSTIRRENPYIFPVFDPSKDIFIFMPPDISPPIDLYRQMKNLLNGQGSNSCLAVQDFLPDAPALAKSDRGIEFSQVKNSVEYPHHKYATGQLYVRQFKLSDFTDALWLLHSTACDAPENNFYGPPDGSDPRPPWFYMPELGATISSEKFCIEMRDGGLVEWSGDIPAKTGSSVPASTDRDIKLYRV